MGYYTTLYSGGDFQSGDRHMRIKLYPNDEYRFPSTEKGTAVTVPLRDACEELLNYGAIDWYIVERFKVKDQDYNYPEVVRNDGDNTSWQNEFQNYLQGTRSNDPNNGTGSDLTQLRGVHYLIHNWGCKTGTVGGLWGTYDCNSNDSQGKTEDTAFATGYPMWMSDACSNENLVRNSSIQEALHPFILRDLVADDRDGDGVPLFNDADEHSAGKVTTAGEATPMATYHATESDVVGEGECSPGGNFDDAYIQTLTRCTKEAVKRTVSVNCD